MKATRTAGGAILIAASALAPAQSPLVPPSEPPRVPLLTLTSPALRTAMEQIRLSWVVPEQLPDFRLKLERPAELSLDPGELDGVLRGVEIRLPVPGLWVGYEHLAGEEEPRATISLQRGF